MSFKNAIVGLALVLGTVVSTTAHAWGYYAAIAWSPSTNRWGYQSGAYDAYTSQAIALRNCGLNDCTVAVTVNNGCAAFSVGANYGSGWAIGVNRWATVNASLYNCAANTYGCRTLAWACTPGY